MSYLSTLLDLSKFLDICINMQTIQELGEAVSQRRKALGLKQLTLAREAGLSPESLSRFERGRLTELGSRKLLALLGVLGMDLQFTEKGQSGSLDELRKERAS